MDYSMKYYYVSFFVSPEVKYIFITFHVYSVSFSIQKEGQAVNAK